MLSNHCDVTGLLRLLQVNIQVFKIIKWTWRRPLKTGFAQISSRCPKNLSCPNFGGGCSPPRPPSPYAYAVNAYPGETVTENTQFFKSVLQRLRHGVGSSSVTSVCVFVWKGKNDSKTQRVDSDFLENKVKNLRFRTKTDTCGWKCRNTKL